MKTVFIAGILLFALGLIVGISTSKTPNAPIDEKKSRLISASILTGFALMIISGIMYLKS